MAKLKISKDVAQRARKASPAVKRRKRFSIAGVLIGLLGWAAAGVLGYFLWGNLQMKDQSAAAYQTQLNELRQRQQNLQAEAAALNTQLVAQVNDLNNQIKEEASAHQSLHQQVAMASKRLATLEQEATKISTTDSLAERKLKQRQDALTAARQAARELRDERAEKEKRKLALIDEYKDRREALKADIWAAMDRDSILGIRSAYARYKHTPYAAAAAFLIGEKAIQVREFDEAKRYFQVVLDEYGQSRYAKHAQTRLKELGAKYSERKFSTITIKIEPES